MISNVYVVRAKVKRRLMTNLFFQERYFPPLFEWFETERDIHTKTFLLVLV